ncbi:uncharacterized protein LOC130730798 [Lotus japonicus]|uniref:uncharacterized protein LOC130730798 n=1 Tax=Lotus japonicus TaxID=34305 RepID=UPI002584FD80|nr:uncharacterized protein LOC130730798 [Lotus japonicus]XP_057438894.1 uncharacterized protein LOC130730798 [Lotus japonicus]XP_057438895.1 uncharacterized protein LOC130730798 [Lotus japonicus]
MSLLQKGLCCGFDIHSHSHNGRRSLKLLSATPSLRTTISYHTPKPSLKTTQFHMHNSLLHLMKNGKPKRKLKPLSAALSAPPPLDLTESNVKQVLADARGEFGQIFDTSAGMTGIVELAELDGPFVKISLKGRFWHERSMVLARIANYLKQRIPEILEVDIEDEKQLDDSPENF